MKSPMVPVPPPTKKQRSNDGVTLRGGQRDSLGEAANDALTRRRMELEELRRQQQRSLEGHSHNKTEDLLAKAKLHLNGEGPLKPNPNVSNAVGVPPCGPPPRGSIQSPNQLGGRRVSDIFPGVPKQAKPAAPCVPSLIEATPYIEPPMTGPIPTPMPTPTEESIKIARRLDQAFEAPTPMEQQLGINGTADTLSKIMVEVSTETSSAPKAPIPKALGPKPPPLATGTANKGNGHKGGEFSTSLSEGRILQAKRPPPMALTKSEPPGITKTTPTTVASATSMSSISSSSRREFISSMRQYADSPGTAAKQNSELELIKELKKAHRDKEDAVRQVVRLRDQVQQLQKSNREKTATTPKEFQLLVEKADREGDRAALKWAREQVMADGSSPKLGLPSPRRTQSPSRRALTPAIGPGVRKRVSTPHPKMPSEVNGDKQKDVLALATQTNPDEFDSEAATYIVRRPYAPYNEEFWSDVGDLSQEDYLRSADVSNPSSLEIAAKIKADGSILTLTGSCNVRHRKPCAKTWRVFEDVDEMDKPLGSVMFVDEQANEGEYWLDEIFEEAMSTRDTYCSSLISTAAALQLNTAQVLQRDDVSFVEPQTAPKLQIPVVVANNLSINLKNREMPSSSLELDLRISGKGTAIDTTQELDATSSSAKEQEAGPAQSNKCEGVTPRPEGDDGPADILSVMLGMLIVGTYNFIWFLAVKLPVRILSLTAKASVIIAVCSISWLYLANDNGAGEMGADVGYGFNQYGIM